MKPDINRRNDMVLDLIIKSYIESAEPVGSRAISHHSGLSLSSASIRNVMSDLEEAGYLKQPHTSAGRIPTDRGYRYWVDSLMETEPLDNEEKAFIQQELGKARTLEGLAEKICSTIAELTDNAAVVYIKSLKRASFLNSLMEELANTGKLADFFEEEPGFFVDGTSHIFEQPEFQDIAKMRMLLHAFDKKTDFLQLLSNWLDVPSHSSLPEDARSRVQVRIGRENDWDDLDGVSFVTKECHFRETPIGSVAVVGPTRMRYPEVVAMVDYVADIVSFAVEKF